MNLFYTTAHPVVSLPYYSFKSLQNHSRKDANHYSQSHDQCIR